MEKIDINILLIDDEVNLLNTLSRVLSNFVTNVHALEDAIEGLNFFKDNKHSIDLVITDLHMPHMNGIELISNIREYCDQTLVYIASGVDKIHLNNDMETYNIKRKIDKPSTINQILDSIKEDFK